MNSFFLNCQLPPNAEGSAEQSEAIGARVRTQVRIFNTCIFAGFLPLPLVGYGVSLTFTASLLEKWFACFPTSGDGLRVAFFPLFPDSGEGFRNVSFCFCDGHDVFFV